MTAFPYRDGEMVVEELSLERLAEHYGTPLYVYSRAAIEQAFDAYVEALEGCRHLVCYAVKANSNIAILDVLARRGAGFDIVSRGELERVLAAGGDPARVVFSGVAKSRDDMERALEVGIRCFNVESAAELEQLADIAAAHGCRAPVSLRVNPDVDARTHPYISTGLRENKFGIDHGEALALYRRAAQFPAIDIRGMDCHIGSQLTSVEPFIDALRRLLELVDGLAADGIELEHLDLGGGLGVRYRDEAPPAVASYIAALRAELAGREVELMFEPGRSIVANAGVLLTRVEYLKQTAAHNFALVDAGMNDFIRPALYEAWVAIRPVRERAEGVSATWDVVGPVCETADFLGRGRELTVAAGTLLAVDGAGAYGFSMASNYNSRGRPAEVLVDGAQPYLIGRREGLEELFARESRLPV